MYQFQHSSTHASFEKLVEGNQRFLNNRSLYPNSSLEYRKTLVNGATPFAAILSCADSRVPPELIFDCGFGDLFVIRNAGNLIDKHVLGSLEFGVDSFQIPLIVVMGHTGCAAVLSAIHNKNFVDHRQDIMHTLSSVKKYFERLEHPQDRTAIEYNVIASVNFLKQCSPTISSFYEKGLLGIIGAVYEIESGKVHFLSE